jgi:hypothetical protein
VPEVARRRLARAGRAGHAGRVSGLWIVLDYEQPGLSPPRTRGSRRWLPQHAWLNGTVLVVERGHAVRQCDLATASDVTLRVGRLDGFLVLRAYEGTSEDPSVLLAIQFQRRQHTLIRPDALRLLAEAIGSRQGSPTHVARELRGMADTEERRNPPVDWSLRTSPQGWRWSSGPG